MDFTPTEDRRLLAETLDRFLADRYPFQHRLAVAYREPWHDPAAWGALCGLGILSALVPEARGGFGGQGFDIATVFESLGRALCPEPVLPALMALRALMPTGRALDDVLDGSRQVALALFEGDGGIGFGQIATRAERRGGGWALSGRKAVVYGGHVAAELLVAARHDDTLGLFSVSAGDARRLAYGMIDGGGAAEILLEATPAELMIADAEAVLGDALEAGALALCAEAVGAMDRAIEMTTEYLRTRRQFGRPIGSFQALQHRLVDLAIEREQARSITIAAAAALGTEGQSRAVSMAKALVGGAARRIAEEAIQMHGGIGMTWEAAIGHYAKRLVMLDHQLGDADAHLDRLAAAYCGG
ncbi:MAG: acyl-CoA dehydrogenase [Paracoccaceae bacterium]|nr:MAG: acyl-CoA dehydrogenase [Paracoccaceae bacterium]